MSSYIQSPGESIDWHIAEDSHQVCILSSLSSFLGSYEDYQNLGLICDINSINAALEDGSNVSFVILLKGNTCNNLLRHIPMACNLKLIPFVSLTKRFCLPGNHAIGNTRAILIQKSNMLPSDVISSVEHCCKSFN